MKLTPKPPYTLSGSSILATVKDKNGEPMKLDIIQCASEEIAEDVLTLLNISEAVAKKILKGLKTK